MPPNDWAGGGGKWPVAVGNDLLWPRLYELTVDFGRESIPDIETLPWSFSGCWTPIRESRSGAERGPQLFCGGWCYADVIRFPLSQRRLAVREGRRINSPFAIRLSLQFQFVMMKNMTNYAWTGPKAARHITWAYAIGVNLPMIASLGRKKVLS